MQAHAEYDEWGKPKSGLYPSINAAGLEVICNFGGYTYDEVLGIYFAQFRFYDPDDMRFLQVDPLRQGLNWYAYCDNDPVNNVDPWGLDAIIITNRESVNLGLFGKKGHTSAIYQDESGDWFYTYWGNKAAAVIRIPDRYIVSSSTVMRPSGNTVTTTFTAESMSSINHFNNALNKFLSDYGFKDITSDYTDATYIVGDFTASLQAAYDDVYEVNTNRKKESDILHELEDGSVVYQGGNALYKLFSNNCLQRTVDELKKGVLPNQTTVEEYFEALGFDCGIIPNDAMVRFKEMFMNSVFTYEDAYEALKNYADLYEQNSPWAQVEDKANYAVSAAGKEAA